MLGLRMRALRAAEAMGPDIVVVVEEEIAPASRVWWVRVRVSARTASFNKEAKEL